MKMVYGRPFEKIQFLTSIDLISGYIMDKIYKWHIHSNSNEGIWPHKKSSFMQGIKSAISEIAY